MRPSPLQKNAVNRPKLPFYHRVFFVHLFQSARSSIVKKLKEKEKNQALYIHSVEPLLKRWLMEMFSECFSQFLSVTLAPSQRSITERFDDLQRSLGLRDGEKWRCRLFDWQRELNMTHTCIWTCGCLCAFAQTVFHAEWKKVYWN